MSIFNKLLKEAVDETEKELEAVEDTVEEITDPEEDIEIPEEELEEPVEGEEGEETDLVSDTRDLIDSVLDAIEEEMTVSGESTDGSIDIGLELISKYADQIPTEALQSIFDEISTYYETELVPEEEGEGEPIQDDEFFEPTEEELVDPDELAVESIINRRKKM